MTTYATVCSGIEAMSVAVSPFGRAPVEEERLFGFPDGYTAITYNGHHASPYARHNVLGNSWAVPCARWICGRIDRSIRGVSL